MPYLLWAHARCGMSEVDRHPYKDETDQNGDQSDHGLRYNLLLFGVSAKGAKFNSSARLVPQREYMATVNEGRESPGLFTAKQNVWPQLAHAYSAHFPRCSVKEMKCPKNRQMGGCLTTVRDL